MEQLVIETLTDDERRFVQYFRSLSDDEKTKLLNELFPEEK